MTFPPARSTDTTTPLRAYGFSRPAAGFGGSLFRQAAGAKRHRGDDEETRPSHPAHHPSTYANMSGATIVASDSMTNFGVFSPSLPHVIFSFGTAPL